MEAHCDPADYAIRMADLACRQKVPSEALTHLEALAKHTEGKRGYLGEAVEWLANLGLSREAMDTLRDHLDEGQHVAEAWVKFHVKRNQWDIEQQIDQLADEEPGKAYGATALAVELGRAAASPRCGHGWKSSAACCGATRAAGA